MYKEIAHDKYILFGSGHVGKLAVDYFGRSNVFCFADNSPEKAGKELLGKKIVSFDTLQKIKNGHTIVITSNKFSQEISAQLEHSGIFDYFLLEEYFCEDNYSPPYRERKFELVRPDKKPN